MSSVSSLKKVTISSLPLEVTKEYRVLGPPILGLCHQPHLGGAHVTLHRKESKLSLLFSIVSSVPSTRLIHNECFINKRIKQLSCICSQLSICICLVTQPPYPPGSKFFRYQVLSKYMMATGPPHSFSGEMENKSIQLLRRERRDSYLLSYRQFLCHPIYMNNQAQSSVNFILEQEERVECLSQEKYFHSSCLSPEHSLLHCFPSRNSEQQAEA